MAKVRISQVFTRSVEEAVAAKKELDQGKPFTQVVEAYSKCPSKNTGGDLGWMPQENMSGIFGMELTAKDKGEAIGPIHSQYGYHILILTEIKEEGLLGGFHEATSMLVIQEIIPEVNALLFEKFKIGIPVFGYGPEETIESVCKTNNKPLNEVLQFLNQESHKRGKGAINGKDLWARLERKEKIVLLDIREHWEHDIANIPEATLITSNNSEKILGGLSLNDEIVLIDWKGERGGSFLSWLSEKGFLNVKCLKGGIDLWATEVDTQMSRYDIDEDDGYRYEDIVPDKDQE